MVSPIVNRPRETGQDSGHDQHLGNVERAHNLLCPCLIILPDSRNGRPATPGIPPSPPLPLLPLYQNYADQHERRTNEHGFDGQFLTPDAGEREQRHPGPDEAFEHRRGLPSSRFLRLVADNRDPPCESLEVIASAQARRS